MNIEMKLDVCKMRLEGYSIHDIAKEIGFTPQSIARLLKSLPEKTDVFGYPDLDMDTMLTVCELFINGKPISMIGRILGIPVERVSHVLHYVTAKKPREFKESAYPEITQWMRMHLLSREKMAERLDVPKQNFCAILAGERDLDPTTANKVFLLTGIRLQQEEARNE